MNGVAWSRHGYGSKGLQNLLTDYGIAVDQTHRAGADVRAAPLLLARTGPGGDTYFRELLRTGTPIKVEPKRKAAAPGAGRGVTAVGRRGDGGGDPGAGETLSSAGVDAQNDGIRVFGGRGRGFFDAYSGITDIW